MYDDESTSSSKGPSWRGSRIVLLSAIPGEVVDCGEEDGAEDEAPRGRVLRATAASEHGLRE